MGGGREAGEEKGSAMEAAGGGQRGCPRTVCRPHLVPCPDAAGKVARAALSLKVQVEMGRVVLVQLSSAESQVLSPNTRIGLTVRTQGQQVLRSAAVPLRQRGQCWGGDGETHSRARFPPPFLCKTGVQYTSC